MFCFFEKIARIQLHVTIKLYFSEFSADQTCDQRSKMNKLKMEDTGWIMGQAHALQILVIFSRQAMLSGL